MDSYNFQSVPFSLAFSYAFFLPRKKKVIKGVMFQPKHFVCIIIVSHLPINHVLLNFSLCCHHVLLLDFYFSYAFLFFAMSLSAKALDARMRANVWIDLN
jgi:hypothetical protein